MTLDALQQGIEDNLPIPNWDELWEAIEKGDLGKYTLKQIEQGMLQKRKEIKLYIDTGDGSGYEYPLENDHPDQIPNTLYQDAVIHGHLDQIPKEILTEENLLKKAYSKGYEMTATCLHFAAINGQLNLIPKEFLTEKNLMNKTLETEMTCLHLASYSGNLSQIPLGILTKKNLLEPSNGKQTCFHDAAWAGHLDKIPLLPHQTLLHLKTHFENDSSDYKNKILALIQNQLQEVRKAELQDSLRNCDHPSL